ncbi:MAG: flagellar FlbD family protein [Candidatus Sericytochromatia bacterium]|nr:flagellar FlbD family protein [Candidatus Sericytochromatia bacterium]
MIRMTRLNDQVIVVNADLIESLEATPDTVVTLTTDRKYVVRESVDELIERIIAYRRACASPSWLSPRDTGDT